MRRQSELWKRQGEKVAGTRPIDVIIKLNAEVALLKRVIKAYDKALIKRIKGGVCGV